MLPLLSRERRESGKRERESGERVERERARERESERERARGRSEVQGAGKWVSKTRVNWARSQIRNGYSTGRGGDKRTDEQTGSQPDNQILEGAKGVPRNGGRK